MLSVPRVRPWSPFPLSLAGYLGHSECEFAAIGLLSVFADRPQTSGP